MVSKYSSSSGVIFVLSVGVGPQLPQGVFVHICIVLYRCYTSLLLGQSHCVWPQSNSWDLCYMYNTLNLNLHWILRPGISKMNIRFVTPPVFSATDPNLLLFEFLICMSFSMFCWNVYRNSPNYQIRYAIGKYFD